MSKQDPEQPCCDVAGNPVARTEACCSLLGGLLEPRFFKALGDGNRIALLSRLAGLCRPCTVSEIACCCPVDLSVVSRHLAILREAGIVDAQRRGKEVLYTVNYGVLSRTFRQIADAIDACCSDTSSRDRKETDNG